MINRFRAAAALLLVSVLANCSGDPTLPDEGAFSFRYSGEISGRFQTNGTEVGSYTSGEHDPAVRAAGGFVVRGMTHEAILTAPGNRPGRYSFAPGSQNATGIFLTRVRGSAPTEEPYVFVSGTLEITHVSAERVRGRFDAIARRAGGTLTIRDGHFDIPTEVVANQL
jgi:hypothetical protein